MKFSIIVPTYNRCHLLWKNLLSLKNQYYSNFEVLVVDDGSTDKTKALVKEFQFDSRFNYIYKKNGGASSARNIGLQNATGDIIVYVDSDEDVYPNFLETIKHYLDTNPERLFGVTNFNFLLEKYDLEYNKVQRRNFSSSQKEQVNFEDILNWRVKTCGTGIFHRKHVKTKWDDEIKLLEDLDFIISMGEDYPEGFLHIPFALFEYRQRYMTDGQCSLASYIDFANGFKAIYEKHNGKVYTMDTEEYLGRFEKYSKLEERFQNNEIPAMKEFLFLTN